MCGTLGTKESEFKMNSSLAVSIIIPARNESQNIESVVLRIQRLVTCDFECLIVVDDSDDSTCDPMKKIIEKDNRFKIIINQKGKSPALAIRSGIESSINNTIAVTMADGSDDPAVINKLVELVNRGVVVAAASRYMAGGQQVGVSGLKPFLSKIAGLTLYHLARVGTHDATNSFKAYDKNFINKVGIESIYGFEIGLELTAKARRYRLPVAELPTIWIERHTGTSNFNLFKWIPKYLKWYIYAFGRRK